jgi:hypothetical protein
MDLSSIDQVPPQHYVIWSPSDDGRFAVSNGSFSVGDLQHPMSAQPRRSQQMSRWSVGNLLDAHDEQRPIRSISLNQSQHPESLPLSTHITRMREASEHLSRLEQDTQRQRRHRDALRWLDENRKAFAGQWVALSGSNLLAAGQDAKEVYKQVSGKQPPALIVKVEGEELPFGGW